MIEQKGQKCPFYFGNLYIYNEIILIIKYLKKRNENI